MPSNNSKQPNFPSQISGCKSWDEFAKPSAPKMDFVLTVCDNAANEICPVWPGQPVTAHWGVLDPAAVNGSAEEIARAFRDAFVSLDRRIALFLSLPLEKLDALAVKRKVTEIGSAKAVLISVA